jgi:hypothetical protein
MEEAAQSWLVREFSVLGVQLQNWMLLVLLLVVVAVIFARRKR